jgi:hypothetical protein
LPVLESFFAVSPGVRQVDFEKTVGAGTRLIRGRVCVLPEECALIEEP